MVEADVGVLCRPSGPEIGLPLMCMFPVLPIVQLAVQQMLEKLTDVTPEACLDSIS
jgi:hypothetical protein